ncbi:hypothetical protein ER308_09555 [Egibacter rhizosphaerae]|uniref:Uncharacterized protein n=1 Tax=Egibacter rhizosphaerae TaxID=1670831 RepID=A0A411YET7_9ACTN|nr:hypothetical protein ER308_09555 [Egibacter rhizosphaerae]
MSAPATDMARFMRAHLGDGSVDGERILEPGTLDRMHAVHEERHPAVTGWRFGFMEDPRVDVEAFGHGGATLHETTEFLLVPDHELGIFVTYNVRSGEANPGDVVEEFLDLYGLHAPDGTEDVPTEAEAGERAETVSGEYAGHAMPDHGPAQLLGLLGRLTLTTEGDGRLVSNSPMGPDREWVEVGPYVYEEVGGPDVLAAEANDGQVAAVHLSSATPDTFAPVTGPDRFPVVAVALGLPLAAFALSLIAWAGVGVGRAWRRRRTVQERGEQSGQPTGVRAARLAAAGLSIAGVAFAGLFATGFVAGGGDLAFITEPLPLRLAYLAPYVVAILALATVAGAGYAWRHRAWSRPVRVHQTALAVLGLAFTWQLGTHGFLGL